MKELSIEEKAQRYDEAIEKAESIYNETAIPSATTKGICTYIFPELKGSTESEGEKIREEIIQFLLLPHPQFVGNRNYENWIAWLEKQGKKELVNFDEAEKEKADFVGDGFIKCYADFQDFKEGEKYWLEYVGDDNYNVKSDNLLGKTYHITPCQLYTVFKKQTWLEKQGERDVNKESFIEGYKLGYREASENIVEEPEKYGLQKQGELKPIEWSEKDDRILDNIETYIGIASRDPHTRDECAKEAINWLKSLKNRVISFPQKEWSEDDEDMRYKATAVLNKLCASNEEFIFAHSTLVKVFYWLESLRPQLKEKPTEEQIDKAANEWERNANFKPIAMTLDSNGKPNGIKQFDTSHADSFKAGVFWLLKQL